MEGMAVDEFGGALYNIPQPTMPTPYQVGQPIPAGLPGLMGVAPGFMQPPTQSVQHNMQPEPYQYQRAQGYDPYFQNQGQFSQQGQGHYSQGQVQYLQGQGQFPQQGQGQFQPQGQFPQQGESQIQHGQFLQQGQGQFSKQVQGQFQQQSQMNPMAPPFVMN